VIVMPTLVLVKDRKVVHHVRGFDELGATEDFSTRALEYVLGVHGVLRQEENEGPPPELLENKSVNRIQIRNSRDAIEDF
jgi:hypothetical protein